jgi:hypothetical protein
MARSLWVALGALVASLLFFGCEQRVKDTVQERLAARAAEGKKKLDALYAERDERIRKGLEDLNLSNLEWDEESEHPLVGWRQKVTTESPVLDTLKVEAPKYPGTDLEKDIPKDIAYFDAQMKFWREPAAGDASEYNAFLGGYATANPDGRFADDALFDEVFLHAMRSFELFKVKPENRATSVFRYWQLAFDFPSLPSEAFMPYIARLCEKDDDFKAFCRKIPFEFRHIAIMQPYYDVLLGKLGELEKKFPETPYKGAITYLTQRFEAEKEALAKEFVEYPILADSMAFLPANQRLVIEAGPKGLKVANRPIEESEDESYVMTNAKARAAEQQIADAINEIRQVGEPELRQGQIAVLAAKETPTEAALRAAWAPMLIPEENQSDLNLTAYLVGRRRFDGSNLKVSTELKLMPKSDAMMATVTTPTGSARCTVVGFTGERKLEMPPPTAAAFVGKDNKFYAGAYDMEAGTLEAKINGQADTVNWNDVSTWTNDIEGAVLYAVDGEASWELFTRLVGPLSFRCKIDDCTQSEPRATPNVYIAFCN